VKQVAHRPSKFGHQFLPGLVLILFLAGGISAVWDYFRVDSITRNLAMREALGLIHQVERELESAARGENAAREAIEEHLFAVAYLIDRLLFDKPAHELDWEEIALEAGVLSVDLFDGAGNYCCGTALGVARQTAALQPESTWGFHGERVLGVLPASSGSGSLYAVAVQSNAPFERLTPQQDLRNRQPGSKPTFGAVVVAVDAAELYRWRSQIGIGQILEHLSDHPEVAFATISNEDAILAATPNLPDWAGGPTDEFLAESPPGSEGAVARFAKSPEGQPFFETATRLAGTDNLTLRIALVADELRAIRQRSLFALTLRTVLFILLGGLTLAYLVSKQNERLLTEEKEHIRREVARLEADRTMRERLEAMGKLAGGVAHEIRNPLNTIELVAQRLELEFEPVESPEEYHTLVRNMRSETKRIGRIVQEFLAFARPPKANRRPGALQETVTEAVELFRPVAKAKGVRIEAAVNPLKPFAFDRDQVAQAIQNLLRNALEAVGSESGLIQVSTGRSDGLAYVEVRDNGPGVPLEERARIFHLYYTTRAEGTGVGLSLTHRIADEHGGRVEVSDTPGGGATFRLYLKLEG